MNARVWAQEATSWYFSHLDPYDSHQSNCKAYLRPPVVALTLAVLNHYDHWMDSLPRETDVGTFECNQKVDEAYEKLTRRTKARLEAFLMGIQMAVAGLHSETLPSVPPPPKSNESLGLIDGLVGFGSQKSTAATVLTTTTTNTTQCPQMGVEEVGLRLELYIRTLSRVQAQHTECVVNAEPPRALRARARSMALALVETVGTVRQQSPVLFKLLSMLLQELLAVDVLGETTLRAVRKITSRYEQKTSFASLAFLSSPDDSAALQLVPLVMDLLKYVQAHQEELVEECELERMLSLTIPAALRSVFKELEFQSIGHLLQVCHEYQTTLENLQLPPSQGTQDKTAIRQALKDLQREVLVVNGTTLPPVSSRAELLELLKNSLQNTSFQVTRQRRRRRRHKHRSPQPPQVALPSDEVASEDVSAYLNTTTDDDEDSTTSGDEQGQPTQANGGSTTPTFHLTTVNSLTRRLLVAASRTGTGGDAYFVVRDLFGGEGVSVVPTARKGATMEITSRTTQSLTIRVYATFNIQPMGSANSLIQLHTVTKEVISLRQRKGALVERKHEWRQCSIRPALYEKVNEWNTPS